MVRALGACGGLLSDVAAAIRWAAGGDIGIAVNPTPAHVINLSLAARQACPQVLSSAIEYATGRDIPVVVAAGNGGTDVAGVTPANCPGVITVAATGREGQRASYSNFGSGVAISAPGGSDGQRLLSTSNSGSTVAGEPSYRAMMGTSMAAPHVAGAIALVRSAHPGWVTGQVWEALAANARPFPQVTARDATTATNGVGILDLVGLLPDPPDWSHVSGVVRRAGRPVQGVDVTAIVEGGGAAYYGHTGPDGSYRVGVPAGRYSLRFDQAPTQTVLPGVIEVAGDVSGRNLDWPARGALAGRVILAGTGQPQPQAIVAVASDNSEVPFRTVTTDNSGGFQVPDLPAGRYRLAVSGPDLVNSWFGGASYSSAAPVPVSDGVDVTGILIVATSSLPAQAANDAVAPQAGAGPSAVAPDAVTPTPTPTPVVTPVVLAAPSLNAAVGLKVLPGNPAVKLKYTQKVTLTAILAPGSVGDRVEFSDSVGVLGVADVAGGRAVLVTRLRGGRQSLTARVLQPVPSPPSVSVVVRVIDTVAPVVSLSWAGPSGARRSVVRVWARDGGGVSAVLVRARTGSRWGSWVRLPAGTETWGPAGWSGKGCVAARASDWAGNVSRTVKRCA
jgi:subtilisin family serine protease